MSPSTSSEMLFTNNINSIGLNIEPCGTPLVTLPQSDFTPFIVTVAVFKKLTNAVVVDTDFINIALTKPSTKSRQRNNN